VPPALQKSKWNSPRRNYTRDLTCPLERCQLLLTNKNTSRDSVVRIPVPWHSKPEMSH
jgi:hypothetical protein